VKNLIQRHAIEKEIMKEFEVFEIKVDTGYTFITSYHWTYLDTLVEFSKLLYNCSDLVPLWDELTPQELDSALTPYGFEATLVVSPEAYWTTSKYVPKITSDLAPIFRTFN